MVFKQKTARNVALEDVVAFLKKHGSSTVKQVENGTGLRYSTLLIAIKSLERMNVIIVQDTGTVRVLSLRGVA